MVEKKYTPRGFRSYAEFKDSHGTTIRIQKSSSTTTDAVWIFAGANSEGESPHLTVEQAKIVRDVLNRLINDYDDCDKEEE